MNENHFADLELLTSRITEVGLSYRGGFHPSADDARAHGAPSDIKTIVLVGNVGSTMWPAFEAGRRDEVNALDNWSKRTMATLVEGLGGKLGNVTPVFPSDGPPYNPFQQWAMRSEPVSPSPIGPFIHPEFGMWHAYRAALLFEDYMELPALEPHTSPCDTCTDQPCLTSCPVGAFTTQGYDVPKCAAHLTTNEGESCVTGGCLARRSCPVGRDYIYKSAQHQFHMGIFRQNYGPKTAL